MRAWVLHDIGDLRCEQIDEPQLADREVLVAVRAAGICGSDIPRIYQSGARRMPLVPGHEFSGKVVKVGKAVKDDWAGKRVGVFPLIPCGECRPCREKNYEMCRQYSYLGSRRDGGFAEYVAVPEWNLIELPESVSYEEAAMLEPMAVAVHALRRIEPDLAGHVVVCGLGTIGLLLTMFLMERGIQNLWVVGNKEYQRQSVLKLGLPEDHYCDSRRQSVEDWVMSRTVDYGADVFFECVGKNETVAQAMNLTAPAGKVCMVGNPHSEMLLEQGVYWKLLRHQLTVTGTWNSSYTGEPDDDWRYALNALQQHRVSPSKLISHRYALEDLEQGFCIMRDKTEDYVKIMMDNECCT